MTARRWWAAGGWRASSLWPQPVADAPDGLDVARLLGLALDLRTQAADVNRDRRRVAVEREAPHLLHELIAREDLAGVAREEEQEIELALRERDLLAGDQHAASGGIDVELTDAQRRLGAAGFRFVAPQDGVDAGNELGGREGLDHVVIGAEPQAVDAIGLTALGGQKDDRHARTAGRAQMTHDLEPTDARQHEIEHDEVGMPGRGAGERGVAVACGARVVVGALEVARDDLGDRRLVVDDENPPATPAGHPRMIAARRVPGQWRSHDARA